MFSSWKGSPSSISASKCFLLRQKDSHLSARSDGVRLYSLRMERTSARRGAESGCTRVAGKYSSNSSRREASSESDGREVVAIAIVS